VAASTSGRTAPRLAGLSWTPYALRLRTPFQTSRERLSVRHGLLVRAVDSDGREGYGEAAPIAGFGMESLAESGRALQWSAERLVGRRPAAGPAASSHKRPSRRLRSIPDALDALDAIRHAPAARHGIECALADLAAQARGVPMYRWLLDALGASFAAPAAIPVNATVGALDPAAAARHAAQLAAQGYGTLKVKVGAGGAQADSERLAAVRKAAPRIVLRVDANGAWTEEEALDWLAAHVHLGLEYAEQPLPRGNLPAWIRLTAASPVPIAADESVLSAAEAQAILAAKAAHLLVLKPMALGGPLPALRVAAHAIGRGVPVVLTSVLEGAFGRTAALHAAAAAQALAARPLPAMGLATGDLLAEDLVADPPAPIQGCLRVPQEPGLGLHGILPP